MTTFRFPGNEVVISGPGAVGQLGRELERNGVERGLLVVSPSLAARSTAMQALQAACGPLLVGCFTEVRPHVPVATVLQASEVARALRVDGVVAAGGGSTIDTARAVALCVGSDLTAESQLHELRARRVDGDLLVPSAGAAALPVLAAPTTLSAAEFSDGCAVSLGDPVVKEIFIGPALAARTVLQDPELALATPADVWAMTGMRAIAHGVETVLAESPPELARLLALEALRRLPDALAAAVQQPDDVEVRAAGQFAAWLSYFGVASGGLGLSHAIGHQLGARLGIPHGACSSIVLPHVVRFLGPAVGERAQAVATALGAGGDAAEAPERLARTLEQLADDLALPRTLSAVGARLGGQEEVEELARAVLGDVIVAGTPRALDLAEVRDVLIACAGNR